MKKLLIGAVVSAVILGSLVMTTLAAPDVPNWGNEVNPGQCDKVGGPIVNVVQKVVNSVDSGEAGNYWAFDHYTRHIQLWATSNDDEYCTVVQYEGQFDAQKDQTSPGAGPLLDGDEDGTFHGGYRATIEGMLLPTPDWKTRGSVGTTDYECNINGNCPGAFNWLDKYFAGGYTFTYEWWGWTYRAGSHGTWVNSVDGNSGDIN